jgi:HEAT repeat protein
MKYEIHNLITDLKAAARIGHAGSLRVALDGLHSIPSISANQPLSPSILAQVILPAGEALANPRLGIIHLLHLAEDPRASVRAIGAVAMALRYVKGHNLNMKDLDRFANDPRSEVRAALSNTLAQPGIAEPQSIFELLSRWIRSDSPRQRQVALQALPAITGTYNKTAFSLLTPLESDPNPEVRAALVETLSSLGQTGDDQRVLDLLERWAGQPEPNTWVIARSLSRSWAAKNARKALKILTKLTSRVGPHRQISNSIQALSRHGAGEHVQKLLAEWEISTDPNLQSAAQKIHQPTNSP